MKLYTCSDNLEPDHRAPEKTEHISDHRRTSVNSVSLACDLQKRYIITFQVFSASAAYACVDSSD